MLRVITDRQGDNYRLNLHGVLGGEWVAVLEQHWRSIVRELPSAKVTLVLSNVDFIDRDGVLRSIQIGEVGDAAFERQYDLIQGGG